MQVSRDCSVYSSQTRVIEPEPVVVNRKRDRMPEFTEVVRPQETESKKLKDIAVVEWLPNREVPLEEEAFVESPICTRKRERDEAEVEQEAFEALVNKMERVSIQTREVLNVVGEFDGMLTLFQKSTAIELDPDASLDMSDEEFVRITTRCPSFTHLTVFQSRSISDKGIIRALMGRASMYAVSLSACPNITDWTLTALGGHCPRLAKLSIAKCPITDEGVQVLASKCGGLRAVSLDWCDGLSDATLDALALNCPLLQEFSSAASCNYTLNGFKTLLKGCSKLQKLELWDCAQVDDAWIDALANSGCPLKELDVSGCWQVSEDALSRLRERFEGITIES